MFPNVIHVFEMILTRRTNFWNSILKKHALSFFSKSGEFLVLLRVMKLLFGTFLKNVKNGKKKSTESKIQFLDNYLEPHLKT